MFISASGFVVTADGNVTASNIDLSGGLSSTFVFAEQKLKVGGTPDDPNVIISASGLMDAPKFRIDEVGFITASGGFLGKWFINDDGLSSLKTENGSTAQDNVDFFLSGSASTSHPNGDRRRMIMSSSFFNVTADGTITASNIDLSGGLTSTFVFADQALKVGGTPDVPNVIISASGLVSSSKFLIDEDGFITASGGKLGAWTIDDSGIENPGKFEIKPDGTYHDIKFSV